VLLTLIVVSRPAVSRWEPLRFQASVLIVLDPRCSAGSVVFATDSQEQERLAATEGSGCGAL